MVERDDNDTMSILGALGVGAGAYALTRRFRPSAIPKLRELQEAAEKGGMSLHVPQMSVVPKVQGIFDKILGASFGMPAPKPSAVKFNLMQKPGEQIAAEHVVNPTDLVKELSSKIRFNEGMRGTDAVPKSFSLDEAMQMVGDNPSRLKKLMGGKYIIKPEHGALEKLSDFASDTDVLRSTAKAEKAFAAPHENVIQEFLPSTNEYRVHYLDGETYGVTNRYLQNPTLRNLWQKATGYEGGGAMIPVFNRAKRAELQKFVQKSMAEGKFGELPQGEHAHLAFDILETPKGYRIVDANTRPGTLMNPIINRQLNRLLTGRWGRDVSALAGLGAGGATYGGLEAFDE